MNDGVWLVMGLVEDLLIFEQKFECVVKFSFSFSNLEKFLQALDL